jgi:hypothetical protein
VRPAFFVPEFDDSSEIDDGYLNVDELEQAASLP